MSVPRRRTIGVALTALAVLLVLGGGGWWWVTRPPRVPESTRRTLFRGVSYVRDVRRQPRPLLIHIVTVDLSAPGVSFLVTPRDAATGRPLRARTTSAFLQQSRTQVA